MQTITLWGKGSVTLPKKWREKHNTKHFMACENDQGNLVISPIEVEYREDKIAGRYGLHFPNGIDMEEFVKIMDALGEKDYGKAHYRAMLKEAKKELEKKRMVKRRGK